MADFVKLISDEAKKYSDSYKRARTVGLMEPPFPPANREVMSKLHSFFDRIPKEVNVGVPQANIPLGQILKGFTTPNEEIDLAKRKFYNNEPLASEEVKRLNKESVDRYLSGSLMMGHTQAVNSHWEKAKKVLPKVRFLKEGAGFIGPDGTITKTKMGEHEAVVRKLGYSNVSDFTGETNSVRLNILPKEIDIQGQVLGKEMTPKQMETLRLLAGDKVVVVDTPPRGASVNYDFLRPRFPNFERFKEVYDALGTPKANRLMNKIWNDQLLEQLNNL